MTGHSALACSVQHSVGIRGSFKQKVFLLAKGAMFWMLADCQCVWGRAEADVKTFPKMWLRLRTQRPRLDLNLQTVFIRQKSQSKTQAFIMLLYCYYYYNNCLTQALGYSQRIRKSELIDLHQAKSQSKTQPLLYIIILLLLLDGGFALQPAYSEKWTFSIRN